MKCRLANNQAYIRVINARLSHDTKGYNAYLLINARLSHDIKDYNS